MFPISLPQVVLPISKQVKLFSLITITPLLCCSFLANSVKVVAQPTPDSTLPNNTIVLPNGNLIDIKGGTRPQNGANLFHSFDNFSVESNKTVRFIHNSGIENIINRITGGSISNINGTIQTLIDGTTNKGNANIFILNPNGIIFGADAKLDIGGSFFASTADSIKFADGSFYSAVNPQEPPLLTINVPLGLQFNNSNAGDIVVQGNGHNLFFDQNTFATVRDNRPTGLQVQSGKTLALVGGNVNLEGGNLTAEQGRIELGSVLGVGLVTFNSTTSNSTTSDWNLDYSQVSNFQDINLTSAASIDVSGNGGGEIQVIGRNISLVDGSAILSQTTGNSTGRTLNIKATDTLKVLGVSFEPDFSTSILNDVAFQSSGNAGKIVIDTKNLIVADGGLITSNTSGNGNAGIVDVTAENIQLTDGFFGPSGIFADANFSTGNGGSIFVKTDNLLIEGGAAIASRTFSEGNGGNLDITAKDIQLVGTAFGEFPSSLSTFSSSPTGNSGNIKVKTDSLKLVDGAQIEATIFDSGNAGELDIQAKQIEISGASSVGLSSGIFAEVQEQATGNGGVINIETEGLQLTDGGQISTSTFGFGNSGDLNIQAKQIDIFGVSPIGKVSGILADVQEQATGNGSVINIETEGLQLRDGGQISTTAFGSGNGGDLNIKAQQIDIFGASPTGLSSGIFADLKEQATGNGGLINIETEGLQLRDGGQISTTAFGSGNGGDLNIKAQQIDIFRASQAELFTGIFADVQEQATGNGGVINIETEGLQLRDGGQISTNAFGFGNSGDLNITAKQIDISGVSLTGLFTGIFAEVQEQATGNGGLINIETEGLQLRDGGQISTNAFGFGNSGDLNIKAQQIDIFGASPTGKVSGILAEAQEQATGNGGLINIETEGLQLRDGGQISIQSLGFGNGGNLQVKAEDIVVSGFINNVPSGLLSSTNSNQGGNVNIETRNLLITQGGQVQALTFGEGNAGELYIKAEDITISGFVDGGRSGLFTAAITGIANDVAGTGNGGKLTVETDKLTIRDGGTISASNFSSRDTDILPGEGQAGNIEINARILELDSNNPQEPASITASSFTGGGGNINLNVNQISASNASQITAEARGSGNGGSLNINSQNFNLSNSALVSTSSQGSGNAGTIEIDVDKINISSNSEISTDSTDLGEAGNIYILFERLEADGGKITATSEQTGGGKITLTATASEIFLRNNSLISTDVFDGTGGGGDINIIADIIAGFEDSDITANADEGNGGNVNITTQGLFGLTFREQTTEGSDITASSNSGLNGTVEINNFGIDPSSGLIELPTQVSDPSKQIATGCSSQDGNTFIVTGRGGIPHNPHHLINLNSTWLDIRNLSVARKQSNSSEIMTQVPNKPAIVEATGFIRNAKGEIEFVASSPQLYETAQVADCSQMY